jgi:hypothetical protein
VDEELQVPFPAPNRRLFYNHAQTLSTTSPSSPVQKRLT